MGQHAISRDSLIFVGMASRAGGDPRALRRAAVRGELVRVRRGVYCDRGRWEGADDRERHLLRIHAVVAAALNPITVAGPSAAVVWGVPTSTPPPVDVVVLDQYRGGGRSEPGVIRHTTTAGPAESVMIFGVPVTTLARTVLDISRGAAFPEAVAYVDWARCRNNPRAIAVEQLDVELRSWGPRSGQRHLRRVVDFSTDLAESFAESYARAVIHELGFRMPQLQIVLRDDQGEMRPDFAWPESRVLLEFDGRAKYADPRFNGGDPVEKLWQERRREARLRRLGWTILRIEWADVVVRERLAALLDGACVPRR
jgi:hypothetical protein